jgi:hypothetical protein
VTASSGHAPKTLWEYGELVLSRDARDGEAFPAPCRHSLVGGALARTPGGAAIRRCATRGARSAWAARPLRLEPHHGRLTLLNKDPGGEPLLRLLRRPWEITSFLPLAIGAVMRLAQLHQRGLIHRDIERANILATSQKSLALAWQTRGDARATGHISLVPAYAAFGNRPTGSSRPSIRSQCRRASRQSLPVTISAATRAMQQCFRRNSHHRFGGRSYLPVMSKRDWS